MNDDPNNPNPLRDAAQAIVQSKEPTPPPPAQSQSAAYLADIRQAYQAGLADARGSAPTLDPRDMPPAPKSSTPFTGLGAPNAVPNQPDPANPLSWSADEIATMRANGTFLDNIKKFRSDMGGGIFAKRPGKMK